MSPNELPEAAAVTTSGGAAPTPSGSDPTIEVVRLWIEEMGRRGLYGSESARFRATALMRLTSVLGESEPRHAQWVLEHVDELGQRFLRKTQSNPDTIKTYVSRAKVSLRDFLVYQKDPAKFTGRIGKPRVQSRDRRDAEANWERGRADQASHAATFVVETISPAVGAAQGELMRLPLGDVGREFLYQLPRGGIKAHEVLRIYWHLLTVATDFEPSEVTSSQMLLLARAKESPKKDAP